MEFRANGQGPSQCGVFVACGAGFPKVANPCYALVKLELAKVENDMVEYENGV